MPALPDTEQLRTALKQVADPEIGANIVDLGLVYRIDITPERVTIDLTLTSPACPMGTLIVEDARAEVQRILPSATALDINVVWEPPWQPSMMTPACRERLGWAE